MIRIVPPLLRAVARTGLRRIAGTAKFDNWTYRVLEQPVEISCRPALFVPEQMGRVKACGFGQSLESEMGKLLATSFLSRPVGIAEFRDVFVLGGHVFHSAGRNLLKDALRSRGQARRLDWFPEVVVPNTFLGLHFFGHWLRDDCSGYEAARDLGRIVSVCRPGYRDAPVYERLLGQNWRDHDCFASARASFVSDVGFSPGKAERLRCLRARLRGNVVPRATGDIVFIRRGVTDPLRNPVNEHALIERLEREGVRIVDGERAIDAVLGETLDARIIIGMEGSQLAHAVYQLREGGGLIALQSPFRFYNPHHEWCRLLGMQYATVVGSALDGGFGIEVEDVLGMIDMLSRRLEALPR